MGSKTFEDVVLEKLDRIEAILELSGGTTNVEERTMNFMYDVLERIEDLFEAIEKTPEDEGYGCVNCGSKDVIVHEALDRTTWYCGDCYSKMLKEHKNERLNEHATRQAG